MGIIHRSAIVSAAVFAPLVFVTAFSAGVSNAVECGWGTVFDPPTNTCVAAPLPPPPPPPPPHQRGTEISPRASGWASACPFPFRLSRRCAPVYKPGRCVFLGADDQG